MTPDMVRRAITVLENQFAPYLQGVAWQALESARAQLETSYREYRRRRALDPPEDFPWGFSIDRELPLEFIDSEIDGHAMRFDMYGRFTWLEPGRPCVERLLVVRVWGLDDALTYREDWDAARIRDELALRPERGRVVARYHQDTAQVGQPGPRSHLQIGGIPGPNELCWWITDLSVPRVPSPPADIILGTELIVATIDGVLAPVFSDPSVEGVIFDSQAHYLVPYFDQVRAYLASGGRLLPRVWNT